jgi:hypothetical protein
MTNVYGRCPACGWSSLFLGEGGHVTCSRLECPRPELVDELIGEIGDARHHGGYTFCSQLVGHVNMTAFAKKTTEKVTAVAHANQQKQRAEHAEALLAEVLGQFQPLRHEHDPTGEPIRWQCLVLPYEYEKWREAAAGVTRASDGPKEPS